MKSKKPANISDLVKQVYHIGFRDGSRVTVERLKSIEEFGKTDKDEIKEVYLKGIMKALELAREFKK